MYPEINGRCHYIGEKIVDIMHYIGWQQINPRIITDDISTTGIVQYDPEKIINFYTTDIDVNNPTWKFEIYQTDQTFRQISTSNADTFNISLPIKFYESDAQTEDGFVCGRISVTGRDNNKNTVNAYFPIFIEFRPPAPQIHLIGCEPNGDRYKLTLDVYSYGAAYYMIDIHAGMFIEEDVLQQSGAAQYVMDHAINGVNYRFDITAVNEYGYSDVSSLDLTGIDFANPDIESEIYDAVFSSNADFENITISNENIAVVNYYNLNGILIFTSKGDEKIRLQPGVYIKETVFKEGYAIFTKINM